MNALRLIFLATAIFMFLIAALCVAVKDFAPAAALLMISWLSKKLADHFAAVILKRWEAGE